MTSTSVPLIVLTSKQDDVEFINRVLRDAGHAAHCHWVAQLDVLGEAIEKFDPQLLWLFCDHFQHGVGAVAELRSRVAATLPLIAIGNDVSEEAINDAMCAGAHDMISCRLKERVRAVAERELRAYHLERALTKSLQSAREYKEQLQTFMAGSVDAIAHATDGILVDVNHAWGKLFGHDQSEMIGPVMDLFDAASHTVIKGALVATAQGQWTGEALKVTALAADGSKLPLSLRLESAMFEGEPSVKLSVPRKPREEQAPEVLMEKAVSKDPETGFYHRRHIIDLLNAKLSTKSPGGVRALAFVRPDRFGDITDQIGPLASEDVLVQLSSVIRDHMKANDLYGRFGGNVFVLWIERGTLRDIEAWGQNLVARIADQIFEVADNTLSLTCTMGVADGGVEIDNLDELIRSAQCALQRGRQRGGNQVVLEETAEEITRIQRFDQTWAHQIRAALVENRFQLGRLPIASLNAAPLNLYDTIIKMLDPQGDEVAAATFLPVAVRCHLIRAIDRWVIDTALRMSGDRATDCLFIKLSRESVTDNALMLWLNKQAESSRADPGKLCLQITEEIANHHIKEATSLAQALRGAGFKIAIEHFGIGRNPQRLLLQMPMDYVKIDGSLMQGISDNSANQALVTEFLRLAGQKDIGTVAERVEDANTMAVLFQLGVGYVQGHYVHEPEVVLENIV